MSLSVDRLLARFHEQVRCGVGDGAPGATRTRAGRIWRTVCDRPGEHWATVESPDGLGDDPDAAIAAERDQFAALGREVEWKTYSYDAPADLGARLLRAGFGKEADEALMLGELTDLDREVSVPAGVVIRPVRTRGDARRIRELYELVWDGAWGRSDRDTGRDAELLDTADSDEYTLLAEESPDGPVLCAARVNLSPGTDFAGFWGGSTHPDWRGRGLFRAIVAERARWAVARGHTLARVDASPDSEAILTRLGLVRVATTTPYKFRP